MKKSLILTTLLLLTATQVQAAVDVHESTSPEYLYNGGYSSEAIRLIQYNKAYSNGTTLRAEEQQRIRNRGFFTKLLDYIDPSRDDGKFFNRNIEMHNPGYEDL